MRGPMAHRLEFFSAGCPLCERFLADVELGKCGGCELEVVDVREASARPRIAGYGVTVAPTLVIDGKIRVPGPIGEPWMCGDEFFAHFERRFGMEPGRGDPTSL